MDAIAVDSPLWSRLCRVWGSATGVNDPIKGERPRSAMPLYEDVMTQAEVTELLGLHKNWAC